MANFNVEFQSSPDFNAVFDNSPQPFDPNMGEVIDLATSERERAYQDGYEAGYSKGQDGVVLKTMTYYRNDTITSITQAMIMNCTKLETLILPKVTTLTGTCTGCTSLKHCDFKSVTMIQSSSFYNCKSLERIEFPAKVTQVHASVFQNCTKLTAVIFSGCTSVPSLSNANSFTNTPIANGTGYIYVRKSLLSKWKAATNWANYADQIRAIEDYPEIVGG